MNQFMKKYKSLILINIDFINKKEFLLQIKNILNKIYNKFKKIIKLLLKS